jgi:hypothetical protein
MLVEIFLDGLFGFADVDGEEKESFGGEVMTDFIDEGGFVGAEAAPGGPEFEKDDFALDGGVIEFFAVVVVALKRGAGSLALGTATRERAARSKAEDTPARKRMGLGDMKEM